MEKTNEGINEHTETDKTFRTEQPKTMSKQNPSIKLVIKVISKTSECDLKKEG